MSQTRRLVQRRHRRKQRVRRGVAANSSIPRLVVRRSNKHLEAQVVDDIKGVTLASCSTRGGEFGYGGNRGAAHNVGLSVGKKCGAIGIEAVRFDRGASRFHGRVAEVASGLREAGIRV